MSQNGSLHTPAQPFQGRFTESRCSSSSSSSLGEAGGGHQDIQHQRVVTLTNYTCQSTNGAQSDICELICSFGRLGKKRWATQSCEDLIQPGFLTYQTATHTCRGVTKSNPALVDLIQARFSELSSRRHLHQGNWEPRFKARLLVG